jgi:hypothetical protein
MHHTAIHTKRLASSGIKAKYQLVVLGVLGKRLGRLAVGIGNAEIRAGINERSHQWHMLVERGQVQRRVQRSDGADVGNSVLAQ